MTGDRRPATATATGQLRGVVAIRRRVRLLAAGVAPRTFASRRLRFWAERCVRESVRARVRVRGETWRWPLAAPPLIPSKTRFFEVSAPSLQVAPSSDDQFRWLFSEYEKVNESSSALLLVVICDTSQLSSQSGDGGALPRAPRSRRRASAFVFGRGSR